MTRPKSYEWEYGMSHGKNQPIIERSDANSEFPWKKNKKPDEITSCLVVMNGPESENSCVYQSIIWIRNKFNIHISQEVALTLKDFTGIVFRYEKHLWYSSAC